ncbi:hypothetical protein [Nocardia tengchongensis]|uniref:hypothetical protein n=1 Tax=Nocardia tengchongensis TaxID=2055889 RepID=UPI00361B2941
MTTAAARAAWEDLNERQQIYLTVLFHADQNLEDHHRQMGATGRYDRTPARVWRRIAFNNPNGPVPSGLRARGVYDTGAGATLAALRDRGLIDTETAPGILRDPVSVWLTKEGRAAARAGTGVRPAPARPPKGLLRERLWRQLAVVAQAQNEGARCHELQGENHLYLCVGYEQFHSRGYLRYQSHEPTGHYVFTDAGLAHYREHLPTYLELYPGVDAPPLLEGVS